jgi:hypothetical protein
MCAHDGDLFSPMRDLFVRSAETSGSSPRRCDSHTRKVSFLPSRYLKSKEPGRRKQIVASVNKAPVQNEKTRRSMYPEIERCRPSCRVLAFVHSACVGIIPSLGPRPLCWNWSVRGPPPLVIPYSPLICAKMTGRGREAATLTPRFTALVWELV